MVGNFDPVSATARDINGVKLAVAGFSDVNARAVITTDGATAAPDDGAGMDDLQAIAPVIENAVAAPSIALRRACHLDTNQPVVADDVVGYRGATVTAVE